MSSPGTCTIHAQIRVSPTQQAREQAEKAEGFAKCLCSNSERSGMIIFTSHENDELLSSPLVTKEDAK